MPDSQAGYGMTVVGNTDILVCGGVYNTSIATCLVYLSTVDAWWTTYPPLPKPVNSFTMLTIHGRPAAGQRHGRAVRRPDGAMVGQHHVGLLYIQCDRKRVDRQGDGTDEHRQKWTRHDRV
ncbi:unnamed protein product [Sphagnum balticum]